MTLGSRGPKVVKLAKQTPTIGGAAYVANDQIGALITFTGAAKLPGGSGAIRSLRILDKSKQAAGMILYVWDTTSPTNSVTDSNAADITDANFDIDGFAFDIEVFTTDWQTHMANNTACSIPIINGDYVCGSASTSIFGLLVATSSVTYTNGDLVLGMTVVQDG